MAANARPRVVERRQSCCPRCQTTRGAPFRVNANEHLLVIGYHCEVCGHDWNVPGAARDVQLQLTRDHSMA